MKPKILVVDDEPDLRTLFQSKFRTQIKNHELEFHFASNGQEALTVLGNQPDLNIILTDINMPVMDGLTFLSHLSKLDRTYKAIVISAYEDMTNIRSAMNRGASDFVTKPIDFADFEVTLKKLIDEYTKLNEALQAKLELQNQTKKQVQVFQRFVPHQFLEILKKESILDIQLGDHLQLKMSVLFSDLRDFTSISERMSPEEMFTFVNNYIKFVEPAIHQNNGFIVMYIGDAMMALFTSSDDAVKAAIDIQKKIVEFNSIYKDERYHPIASGIGLHMGQMTLGIVGVDARMQGTVISDVVNVAARMETVASTSSSMIIASDEFMQTLSSDFKKQLESRSLGKIQVKGKQQSIPVSEIICSECDVRAPTKIKTKQIFLEGLTLFYKMQFKEAILKFQEVLEQNPQDKVAMRYLTVAEQSISEGVSKTLEGLSL